MLPESLSTTQTAPCRHRAGPVDRVFLSRVRAAPSGQLFVEAPLPSDSEEFGLVKQAKPLRSIGKVKVPPLLARLSFWVPPERKQEFEGFYEAAVAPLLRDRGWVASTGVAPAAVDSVFSRLFELKSVDAWRDRIVPLQTDEEMNALLPRLGEEFGTFKTLSPDEVPDKATMAGLRDFGWAFGFVPPDGRVRTEFELYSVPVGDGLLVRAGAGRITEVTSASDQIAGEEGPFADYVGRFKVSTQSSLILSGEDGKLLFRWDGPGQLPREMVSVEEDRFHVEPIDWDFTAERDGSGRVSHFIISKKGRPPTRAARVEDEPARRPGLTGTGRRTKAGGGRRSGEWFTLDVADGLPSNVVYGSLEDRDGNLWFATESGVTRYDGEYFTSFTTNDGLVSNWVNTVFEDSKGDLWFGAGSFKAPGGVATYDGQRFTNMTSLSNVVGGHVTAIFEDRKGKMWFGTIGSGVTRYDGERFTTFTEVDGLASDWVCRNGIVEDADGNLWFANNAGGPSHGNGFCRYNGSHFSIFSTEDGLPASRVWSLLADSQGRLWIGGDRSGVTLYNGNRFVIFTEADGLGAGHTVQTMREDSQGNIWFGTHGVLNRYDGHRFVTFDTEDGLAHDVVSTLLEDREGNLWVGTGFYGSGGGVSRFAGEQFTAYKKPDGLADEEVLSLVESDSGELWIGTADGLSRFNGDTFTNFTTDDGLVHGTVESLMEDSEGVLWMSYGLWRGFIRERGGVTRFDGVEFTSFTEEDSLTTIWYGDLIEDQQGHVLMGGHGGVRRYDGSAVQTLLEQDGLAGNRINDLIEDRHGNIWVGTEGGLTRYRIRQTPPPVKITDVVGSRRYGAVDSLRLPSSQQLVAFEFGGRSFKTRPGELLYLYRLRGHHDDWRQTREQRVEYNELPLGEYLFEVKAVDRDLTYSEKPATVELEVFHQEVLSPASLSDLDLDDLFPSYYLSYAHQPIGSVSVTSNASDTMDVELSLYLPDVMSRPFEQTIALDPNSSQRIEFKPILDERILERSASAPVRAEVAISFEQGDQTLSLKQTQEITVHRRGALQWDHIGRAAAFVTPTDEVVEAFARSPLVAFEEEIKSLGKPVTNLLQARVLFEALRQHGVRYREDADTPYARVASNQTVVDEIQYPAELLHKKAGDCDDLTVLFCSLLHNANIKTALVDYPSHIFLLFDSGVAADDMHHLPLNRSRYIARNGRLWIPLEITLLKDSFAAAWKKGLEELATLPEADWSRLIVDTEQAWQDFPSASPSVDLDVVPPARADLVTNLQAQLDELHAEIEDYIETNYLDPLSDGADETLRLELIRLYLRLHQYDTAITTATNHLLDSTGDKAESYNHLGMAYLLKGEVPQAALNFQQAVQHDPDRAELRRNLEYALAKTGRSEAKGKQIAAAASDQTARGSADELALDDLFWTE